MRRRDMKLLLEERFERIALLETRIDTMDQLVEGYRAREQSIFDTLQAAKESAANIVEQAKAERARLLEEAEAVRRDADDIRLKAREEAEALLSEAINTANTLKKEAERQGVELSASVKADSERMLRDAEIIKREYEEMVDSFNAMLEQNASELEITAARFAEFVKHRKIDRSEVRLDGNAFYKSVGELSDANLPDASEDPSLLMQNIYRIQNRPLPEEQQATPPRAEEQSAESEANPADQAESAVAEPVSAPEAEQITPALQGEDGSGADEQMTIPFSEAAWSNEQEQSKPEPQAEFTKAFDDAFVPSDYMVRSEECSVSQADVESAFDALLTDNAAGALGAAAIPATSALVAEHLPTEQQDDAVRAFDEFFSDALEPSGKLAQDEVAQQDQQGPEGSLPMAETVAGGQTVTTAPEPYSAQAWSQNSFASDLEPQAEGTLFDDASDLAIEPERVEAASVAEATPAEPVSGDDIDRALDDYLAGNPSFAPSAPSIAQSPAPQETTPVENISINEAERELDAYLAQMNAFAPPTGDSAQTAPAPEPYSEGAWSQSAFVSGHEPQAEGGLFAEANELAQEPVTASSAERELDAYLAQMNAFAPPTGVSAQTASAPEPYSEEAWSQSAFVSGHEPQAEGGLFTEANELAQEPVSASSAERELDAYLAQMNAFAPQATAAPEPSHAEVAQETAPSMDAKSAFDDYLAGLTPMEPETPITAIEAPAPYSQQAWANMAISEYEPQAEGSSFLANEEPEEEPEPAPAPRKYNDYGEIREWEPEPEPEMEDIPTVSRFMGQSNSDEISLDDLLDEIIKAGE